MSITSAVVLAGGEGQRLRPLTEYRPKPLLPAANKPILEHVFDALINAGIDDLHVVVGYGRDRVRSYFGPTHRDRTITYHTQESQLGSGHALLQARDAVDGDFVATNGDEVVTPGFVRRVIEAHTREDVATLGVIESDLASEFGAVELDGTRVTALRETPHESEYELLNAGVYAFGPSIFGEIEQTEVTDGERAITDTIAQLISRTGNIRGVRTDEPRTEVTYPWDLLALSAELTESGAVGGIHQAGPERYVAETASVNADATLIEPIVVGPDAVIEAGAVVGPAAAIGRNATIEANATVQNAIVDEDSRICRNATLVDSVTGVGTAIGVGVTLPGGPSDVQVERTVHESQPLGSVVADRARVGGGATVVPGTLVGPESRIAPGVRVARDVPKESEVIG